MLIGEIAKPKLLLTWKLMFHELQFFNSFHVFSFMTEVLII